MVIFMNILLTLNNKYLPQMTSLIRSIEANNDCDLNIYIISNDLTSKSIEPFAKYFSKRTSIAIIPIKDDFLKLAPTSKRYPKAIYYRIFASKFLPDSLDRILYLDPDIIVNGDITSLYNIDLGNNLFAGATTIKKFLTKFNEIKNSAPKGAPYLNTGVLLMNLKLLRIEQNIDEVIEYIERKHLVFTLPDQDIISGLYGDRILLIDSKIYNLSDRGIRFYNLYNKENIDYDWVKENTKIIHFYGRNKPWNDNYHGILKSFYDKYKID